MGHRVGCACGSPVPWSWDVWSAHNSQHLVDPYTFTHLLHGVLYYALLRWLIGPRWPHARVLRSHAAADHPRQSPAQRPHAAAPDRGHQALAARGLASRPLNAAPSGWAKP